MTLGQLLAVTLALVAPSTSVFLTFGAAYRTAGPGVMWSYVIASVIVLAVMLCYAELGSVFPDAGGDYALASQSLGRSAGRIVGFVFLAKGAVLPAVLTLGAATYLHDLVPALPVTMLVFLMLFIILGLSLVDLRQVSQVIAAMLIIEVVGFLWFLGAAIIALHVTAAPHLGPGVHPARWGMLEAAVPALYGLNGPQGSLYYSEEVSSRPETYGHAIVAVTVITILIELAAVTVGTMGVQALGGGVPGSVPLMQVVRTGTFGRLGSEALELFVAAGLFNAALTTAMSYGRVYYAMVRDRKSSGFTRLLGTRDRRGVPRAALIVLIGANLLLTLVAPLHVIIVLLGALVMVVYGIVAMGALLVRRRIRVVPYRMPAWPGPALFAVLGLGVLLPVVPAREKLVMAGMVALGLLTRRRRPAGR